jgi:hypothetical protein
MIDRTAGEISAHCHRDEQANNLARNLAHDIVTDRETFSEARQYYSEEFTNARRKVDGQLLTPKAAGRAACSSLTQALDGACHRASSSKPLRARFEDQQGERSSDSNGGEVDHQLDS